MILSLRQLELGKIRFDERFTMAQLSLDEPGIEIPDGVKATGEAEMASVLTGEIRLKGEITGTATSACDRCLQPIEISVSGPFKLSYEPRENEATEEEVALSEKDVEVGYYEGDALDLADVVREQVLLALPMQKLCREECQGLCPVCGIDRNDIACQCTVQQVDERWAALKSLKN